MRVCPYFYKHWNWAQQQKKPMFNEAAKSNSVTVLLRLLNRTLKETRYLKRFFTCSLSEEHPVIFLELRRRESFCETIKVYEILWNFMKSWETPQAKDCNGIQPEVAGWCRGCWNKGGTSLIKSGSAKTLEHLFDSRECWNINEKTNKITKLTWGKVHSAEKTV